MNEEFLKVINKHERIKNLYDIGPVQIGDFLDDIMRVLDNGYFADFHQFLLDYDYIQNCEQ